jgi:hypothetical protein
LGELGHAVEGREESFGTFHFARPNGVLIQSVDGTLRGGVNQYKPAMAIGL